MLELETEHDGECFRKSESKTFCGRKGFPQFSRIEWVSTVNRKFILEKIYHKLIGQITNKTDQD